MKKERLFYLDFVRAIATLAIVVTHFNARYLFMNPPAPEKTVLTTSIGNLYIGDWGVSLFFIISGAALMYVYEEKCRLKTFYKSGFCPFIRCFGLRMRWIFCLLCGRRMRYRAAGSLNGGCCSR